MEASGAGLGTGNAAGDGQAASDGGAQGQQAGQAQQTGQQQGQETAQQQASPDVQQLMDMLGGVSETTQEMNQFLKSQAEAAQAAEAPAEEALDTSFLDETLDPAQAAQKLQEFVKAQVEAGVKEQMTGLQETVSKVQNDREADMLVAEHPELGDPKVAQGVMDTAMQLAQRVGHPELAASAEFIKLTYMATRATEFAEQQNGAAAASNAATLEGAGGASPGGAQQGDSSAADAIGAKWAGRPDVLARL